MSDSKEYSSDWAEDNGKILRSALGRTGFIGELYDARTEKFTTRPLFSSSFPQTFIKSQQSSKSEIECTYSDQLSDRFNLLKIEADLQLSILLGQFSLSGNGKYLGEEKHSERTVICSLLYNFSTVCDKLLAPFNEIVEFIDESVFADDQYTHLVVEINWGANCTFTFEHCSSDLSKKTEAKGKLEDELKKLKFLINPQAFWDGNSKNDEKEAVNNINMKLYADVPLDGKIPNSVESAVEYINKIPELLSSVNDGKGIPLKYAMIPLETFKKLCSFKRTVTTMLKTIDESFIVGLVCFFEDIAVVKQKLNDLKTDLAKFEKYLQQDCLSSIRQIEEEIKINETKLKTDLAEDLPKVKSGAIAMRDLIKKLDRHKSSGLNIVKIEDFIEEFEPVKKKINFINFCLSKNVLYLGKDDDLDFEMNSKLGNEFFVMYISKELKDKNEKLYKKSLNFFLAESKSAREDFLYIIVDFDINKKIQCEIEDVKIVHYKGGKVIAHDVYKEHEAESAMNFAKVKNSKNIIYVQYKPVNRVHLELVCPGWWKGICPKDPLIWVCRVCKVTLEYSFDNYFHCSCGKAESHLFEFRCSSSCHGNEFIPVDNGFPLKQELDKIRPLKQMNILILGKTGVGKSTWINSIINYFNYETIEQAEKGDARDVDYIIPSKFSISNINQESQEVQEVKIGNDDPNEDLSTGNSGTREPQSYNFLRGDRVIRLIDTPGIGDTGGTDKDEDISGRRRPFKFQRKNCVNK